MATGVISNRLLSAGDLQGKSNRGKTDSTFGREIQLAGVINVPLLAI
jgi:hypothetical protein